MRNENKNVEPTKIDIPKGLENPSTRTGIKVRGILNEVNSKLEKSRDDRVEELVFDELRAVQGIGRTALAGSGLPSMYLAQQIRAGEREFMSGAY